MSVFFFVWLVVGIVMLLFDLWIVCKLYGDCMILVDIVL